MAMAIIAAPIASADPAPEPGTCNAIGMPPCNPPLAPKDPSKSLQAPPGIVPCINVSQNETEILCAGETTPVTLQSTPPEMPNRITDQDLQDPTHRSIPPLAPGLSPKVQHGYVNPPEENPYLIAAGIALCVVMVTAALYWIARVFLWPSHKDDRPNNHPEQPAHTGTNERPFL